MARPSPILHLCKALDSVDNNTCAGCANYTALLCKASDRVGAVSKLMVQRLRRLI